MKKISIIILLLIVVVCLTGCKTLEEIMPDINDFSEWDGNYIYRGNLRCKTTGEDTERLVNIINYNNKIYLVQETLDYIHKDDDIYMILKVKARDDQYNTSMLIKYNRKTNKSEFIYNYINENNLEEMIYKIIYLDNNCIYMKYKEENYIYYNLINKEEKKFNAYRYSFLGDYIIINDSQKIMYSLIYQLDFKTIYETKESYTLRLVNKNNKEYLLIKTNVQTGSLRTNRLLCYDFNQDILIELVEANEYLNVIIVSDDYYIIGKEKEYQYVSGITNYETKKKEILSETLITNNKLYKIDYDNLDIELIYTFDKDKDYTSANIKDEKTLILNEVRVIKGNAFFEGGSKKRTVTFNVDTKKFKIYKPKTEEKKEEDKIICDEYEYYFKTQRYGGYYSHGVAYFFYSYNTKTKEENLLQFFAIDYDEMMGIRYSKEMWETEYSININDYLILNY